MEKWQSALKLRVRPAAELTEPILINTVPAFLDHLCEALAAEHPRRFAGEGSNFAQEHGGERARLTRYGPEQLIIEYHLLRDTLLSELSAVIDLTPKERQIITYSIDQALCQAMTAFFLVHNRIREQFVATLGHDLRNPLSAAKMSAELILEVAKEDERGALKEISTLASKNLSNIKRIDRMIQDLLDASVIQVGEKIPLKFENCELESILREVVDDLPPHERSKIELKTQPTKGIWDSDGLRRAFENLVSNAFKYGDTSKPIIISLTEINQRVIVKVHNAGTAIPTEEQEFLFQPFRRSREAASGGKKGWGIGLGLVRGVAEGHGGSIGVESSPELGTTFVFDIPVDSRSFKNVPTLR